MEATGAEDEPLLSVVVPTRDRVGSLVRLLTALEAQSLPRATYEVVVVDDGSVDAAAVAQAAARADRVLRHERSGGPATAREAGWRSAAAALVAFTDDDCRPEPGWLEALLAAHRAAPGAIVQGRTRPEPDGEGELAKPRARSIRVERLGPFFETCNVAYPRALLQRVGGFDVAIPTAGAEDTDLALRALATGAGAVFAPRALVNHEVIRPTLGAAVRGAGRWRTQVGLVRRHPRLRAAFPWRGRVWREAHARLLLAFAGVVLVPVDRRFALWLVPYLTYRHGWRPAGLARTLAELPGHVVLDAAEVAVLAAASARERTLFL